MSAYRKQHRDRRRIMLTISAFCSSPQEHLVAKKLVPVTVHSDDMWSCDGHRILGTLAVHALPEPDASQPCWRFDQKFVRSDHVWRLSDLLQRDSTQISSGTALKTTRQPGTMLRPACTSAFLMQEQTAPTAWPRAGSNLSVMQLVVSCLVLHVDCEMFSPTRILNALFYLVTG